MALSNEFNNEEIMSEINMTPLVDVMLVLLIIFIITIPVITHSIKIDLPQASNSPSEIKPEPITLSITKNNVIYWNDEVIHKNELLQRLRQVAAQTPQPELQLFGARDVEYQHVIQLMSSAQQAGILKLGFITESEK